jgi:hypothetical protein
MLEDPFLPVTARSRGRQPPLFLVEQQHHGVVDAHRLGERRENAVADFAQRQHRDHRIGDLAQRLAVSHPVPIEHAVDEPLESIAQRVERQDREEQEADREPRRARIDVEIRHRGVGKGDGKGVETRDRQGGHAVPQRRPRRDTDVEELLAHDAVADEDGEDEQEGQAEVDRNHEAEQVLGGDDQQHRCEAQERAEQHHVGPPRGVALERAPALVGEPDHAEAHQSDGEERYRGVEGSGRETERFAQQQQSRQDRRGAVRHEARTAVMHDPGGLDRVRREEVERRRTEKRRGEPVDVIDRGGRRGAAAEEQRRHG